MPPMEMEEPDVDFEKKAPPKSMPPKEDFEIPGGNFEKEQPTIAKAKPEVLPQKLEVKPPKKEESAAMDDF